MFDFPAICFSANACFCAKAKESCDAGMAMVLEAKSRYSVSRKNRFLAGGKGTTVPWFVPGEPGVPP